MYEPLSIAGFRACQSAEALNIMKGHTGRIAPDGMEQTA
jgi:hypothetical protein